MPFGSQHLGSNGCFRKRAAPMTGDAPSLTGTQHILLL
ncbi:hypothetical protein SCH4B_0917 [Ruegeria sp. TrichCH4B]|nr:hypothetical protein SCH4B_0917 [Ruegeria sp. TrichCH4B]